MGTGTERNGELCNLTQPLFMAENAPFTPCYVGKLRKFRKKPIYNAGKRRLEWIFDHRKGQRGMKIGNAAEKEMAVRNGYGKDRLENAAEKEQKDKGQQGKSIQASELNLFQDGIADRKKKAMKDAMDFVKKQFESDSEVDAVMDECRTQIEDGKEQTLEASGELKSIEEQKAQLREEYPDGGEEYDAYMKDLNEQAGYWKKEMVTGQSMVSDSTKAIKSMKQEALKHHGMVDASKAAEKAMEAASKEIVGMLLNEAKDTVDEKLEETVEKAEETKEEKTEQEEEMKEAQAEQEKQAQEIEEELEKQKQTRERRSGVQAARSLPVEDLQDRQQKILENTRFILEEQNLLPEEIKGIMVDFNL